MHNLTSRSQFEKFPGVELSSSLLLKNKTHVFVLPIIMYADALVSRLSHIGLFNPEKYDELQINTDLGDHDGEMMGCRTKGIFPLQIANT
jgi:hypothetical protein